VWKFVSVSELQECFDIRMIDTVFREGITSEGALNGFKFSKYVSDIHKFIKDMQSLRSREKKMRYLQDSNGGRKSTIIKPETLFVSGTASRDSLSLSHKTVG